MLASFSTPAVYQTTWYYCIPTKRFSRKYRQIYSRLPHFRNFPLGKGLATDVRHKDTNYVLIIWACLLCLCQSEIQCVPWDQCANLRPVEINWDLWELKCGVWQIHTLQTLLFTLCCARPMNLQNNKLTEILCVNKNAVGCPWGVKLFAC